jgi:hypothetical protein
VEIIMPEFWDPMSGPIFPEKGDNEKFWKMCKRFVDGLIEDSGASNPLVVGRPVPHIRARLPAVTTLQPMPSDASLGPDVTCQLRTDCLTVCVTA